MSFARKVSPDPQTLLAVVQVMESGNPAPGTACRAGACPIAAPRTGPIRASSISSGESPDRATAAFAATAPSSGAESSLKAP